MFNLKEFQDGIPAVTRVGELVYYVALVNKNNKQTLVGVTQDGVVVTYNLDGRWIYNESRLDLVDMKYPEKDYWVNVYLSGDGVHRHIDKLHDTEKAAISYGKLAENYIKTVKVTI